MSRVSDLTHELRRLAAQGYTVREAAAALGMTQSGAKMAAKRNGFRFVKEAERTIARVRACAEEGLTQAETARLLGMNRATPGRIARENSFVFRLHDDIRREEAQRVEAERLERERAEAMSAWRAKLEAEREAAERAQRDPVRMVLTLIERHGVLRPVDVIQFRESGVTVDEAVLGAAMARIAPGRAAMEGRA